jgi:REP element-mobilizing transposase RayT
MPRRLRLFIPGATYHVYCRVARGEAVFDNDNEVAAFVSIAQEVRDLDGLKVLAWCLMGNHYHLVLTTGEIPLWRSMARLQGRVSRGFNRRRQYVGRLWQSRYKARVIDSQDYFRQVVAYVHLNPVAAGIVTDPARYPHSGHRSVLGLSRPLLVDVEAVLHGFGGRSTDTARDQYLGWLRAVAEARWFSAGIRELPWWERARDADEIAVPARHPEAVRYDGQRPEPARPPLDLQQFARRLEAVSAHRIVNLASRRREPDIVQSRIDFTMLAVARYGFRSSEVAELLRKSRSSLTRWLRDGIQLESHDSDYRLHLDALDNAIAQSITTDPGSMQDDP